MLEMSEKQKKLNSATQENTGKQRMELNSIVQAPHRESENEIEFKHYKKMFRSKNEINT